MFKDEIQFEVAAGKGGNGAVSFHREKFVPRGGPDGGDGGDGGDVVLKASRHHNSLIHLAGKRTWRALDGQGGMGQMASGRAGADLVLEVPIGTQVFDAVHGNLLRDLTTDGMTLVVAKGGKGGLGNARFATATRQTPRFSGDGRPGEEREVRLELKLFAEVGLVGLPNAGKSTFLKSVTAATPRIADYPFTTLSPQVGIARLSDIDTLVLADLPGLIEGASEGVGLGHRFLKHVERCGVVLHLVDCSEDALVEPDEARRVIERELGNFDAELARKPRLLVATKVEGEAARERAQELARRAGRPVLCISSHTRDGLKELLVAAHRMVRQADLRGVPG